MKMESTIETPRLRLIHIEDTDIDSQHLQWFHQLWSDETITAWRYSHSTFPFPSLSNSFSLHGKCHTLEESQAWMKTHKSTFDSTTYAVFEKKDPSSNNTLSPPGNLVGMVLLRKVDQPTLPPFPPPSTFTSTTPFPSDPSNLNIRSIGYAFFQSAWGQGYATEASKAVITAYSESIAKQKDDNGELFFLEGCWNVENPASEKVLGKLGFMEVGWKDTPGKQFLAGAWRGPGYWVWGTYV
jgi:RimJ/RimL family protein N-acetyltransferase